MPRCILFLRALIAVPACTTARRPTPHRRIPPNGALPNSITISQPARAARCAFLLARAHGPPDAADKPARRVENACVAGARKSPADDAVVWWATAGVECHAAPKACPAQETLQQLEKADAQNAATWSLAFARARQAKDDASARAALTSAAQSTLYDDHFGALIALLDEAADILPVSEEILRASGQGGVSTAGYKLTFAAGIAASLPQPGLRAIVEACQDSANDADMAADCIALAQKIADSGSLITRSYGVKLLIDLQPAGAQQDAARARARTLAWQTQRIGELGSRLADDSALTRVYLDALGQHGQEDRRSAGGVAQPGRGAGTSGGLEGAGLKSLGDSLLPTAVFRVLTLSDIAVRRYAHAEDSGSQFQGWVRQDHDRNEPRRAFRPGRQEHGTGRCRPSRLESTLGRKTRRITGAGARPFRIAARLGQQDSG